MKVFIPRCVVRGSLRQQHSPHLRVIIFPLLNISMWQIQISSAPVCCYLVLPLLQLMITNGRYLHIQRMHQRHTKYQMVLVYLQYLHVGSITTLHHRGVHAPQSLNIFNQSLKPPYLSVPAPQPHGINCTRLSWVLQSHLTDTRSLRNWGEQEYKYKVMFEQCG